MRSEVRFYVQLFAATNAHIHWYKFKLHIFSNVTLWYIYIHVLKKCIPVS